VDIIKKDYQRIDSGKDVVALAEWFGDMVASLMLEDKYPYLIKIEVLKDSLRDKK